jgi:hypothetical protein
VAKKYANLLARWRAIGPREGTKTQFHKHNDDYWNDLDDFLAEGGGSLYRVGGYMASSTSDFSAALAAAYTDAASDASTNSGPAVIELPAGRWRIGSSLNVLQSRVVIVGSPFGTELIYENGIDLEYGIRFGPATTSTDTVDLCGIVSVRINGADNQQSGGTGGLVEFINAPNALASDLELTDAYGAGFVVDTRSDGTAASFTDRGTFRNIDVRACQGEWAVKLLGPKNCEFPGLKARNNGRGGILCQGKAFTSNDEATQNRLIDFTIHDNGQATSDDGWGLAMDNCTRWVVDSGLIDFNPRGAIEFRRTIGTAGTDGANQGQYSGLIVRNNGDNANCDAIIGTQNSGDLTTASLSGITLQNTYTTNPDQKQLFIEGADELQVDHVNARLGPGLGMHFKDCTQAQLTSLVSTANGTGTPSSGTPHGIWIEGGHGQLDGVTCANAKTNATHSAYELNITGSPDRWALGSLDLDANADGYEFFMDSTAYQSVRFGGVAFLRGDSDLKYTLAVSGTNANVALPFDVGLLGHVRLSAAAATTIDSFTWNNTSTHVAEGTEVWVTFADANVTLNDASGDTGEMLIHGGNYAGATDKAVIMRFISDAWRVVAA